MNFQQILGLAKSAVHVTEALTATGHVADTPEAQKGFAVSWVEQFAGRELESVGLAVAEPLANSLIEKAVEFALAEAKAAAAHLPGGFGSVVAGLIDKLG